MAAIEIYLNNRSYQIACDDGQEKRLLHLARMLDERVQKMRQQFGAVNDEKYLVFAALMVADELLESQEQVAEAERQIVELKRQNPETMIAAERQRLTGEHLADLLPLVEKLELIAKKAEDA